MRTHVLGIGLLFTCLCCTVARPAQDPNLALRRTPIVKAYETCHEAVVNISGQRVVTTSAWPGFDLPSLFDLGGPAFQQKIPVLGSGFVVHPNGYIVTNAHVVQGTDKIKAIFSDGREYEARVVNEDSSRDLAVLAVETDHPLHAVRLGKSHDLMIGESVIAIGNPYGYSNTLTSGVISALSRDIQVSDDFWLRGLIQTDASINPGNSGGPLLNIIGDLIGINTAIKADAQNIGFAIPVDTLVNNISHMLMPEQLRRVRLGLSIGRLKTVKGYRGLLVESVTPLSPADQHGIRHGDLLLRLDGKPLTSMIDFYVQMINKAVGEPMTVDYVQPTEALLVTQTATLTLAPRPIPDGKALAEDFFQMSVSELTDTLAQRFNFESAYPVLIVTQVRPQGQAHRTGLKPGDLILRVHQNTVRNLTEFSLEMEKVSEGQTVDFEILRIGIGVFGQVEQRYAVKLRAQRIRPGGRL
ncbi:MAG: trypsin-like peptidase domain-containing protein [Phycisphaerae bacterium]|nr:trypsin-like peptidase domain-containing protein [Phycisphaerae bacterium]